MIAALVGDPARSNMLTALMTGRALTASELAHQAGVTPQTASSHLSKLEAGGLVEQEKQGRHRYYRLSDPDVAAVLEGLEGLAARAGHMRVRTGPKDPALRHARVCYDHLAGDLGVQMLDSMKTTKMAAAAQAGHRADPRGRTFPDRYLADLHRSTGASAPAVMPGLPRLERTSPSSGGHFGSGDPDPLQRAEMGDARCHARQPRGQLHPPRRKALRGAVRRERIARRPISDARVHIKSAELSPRAAI